ncbi:MAG: aldo/keto reductase [Deltaproteobacteria bacterium HGW-Deltaproteobacteria-15]|nr:MAG: aldo/keto reductase [Deltaproteobacteria bacterium HGW-Deltaproteobacteria-15]
MLPKRRLGKTDMEITIMGLGGEGILRTYDHEDQAYRLINRAIDLGINYFESARAYSGSEAYYGLALKERRKEIYLTSKSHGRDKETAMDHLRQTLKNMRTDYLDLWQVHDVRTEEDIREIFGPGGAIEAFAEAREKGLVRYIGVTGHHNPLVTRRCMELYEFDTVLLPVNPAEPFYRSFIEHVIPAATEKGMGIVAMKVYFRGFVTRIPEFAGLGPFFRFALSHPVSTAVIGCDSIEQLEENVYFADTFTPMSEDEMTGMMEFIQPYAKQLMYYKP